MWRRLIRLGVYRCLVNLHRNLMFIFNQFIKIIVRNYDKRFFVVFLLADGWQRPQEGDGGTPAKWWMHGSGCFRFLPEKLHSFFGWVWNSNAKLQKPKGPKSVMRDSSASNYNPIDGFATESKPQHQKSNPDSSLSIDWLKPPHVWLAVAVTVHIIHTEPITMRKAKSIHCALHG